MAKSYYGYSERDLDRYTDWAEVSKTISDSLNKEVEERRKIKTELDAQLNKDMDALANAPQSEHAGIAEQVADYTSGVSTLMLGLNRDFKSGKTKYSDYIARTNNLRNGTDIVFSKTKELSAMYDEVRKRSMSKDGAPADGAYQEQWQAAMLQSYLDPTTTKLVIDPNSFRVNVAKKKINPKTGVEEVGDFQPVASLYTRLNQKVNNFKLDQMKEDMGSLGQVIKTIRTKGSDYTTGQVLSVEDVLSREEGRKALNDYVSGYMSPDNKSSILTNWIRVNPKTGKSFDFTMDANEAAKDPNKILLALDPENKSSGKLIAQPSKEQTELVRSWLTEQAKAQLKYIEKRDMYNEARPSDYVRGKGDEATGKNKEDVTKANMAGLFYYGNDADVAAASEFFKGIDALREKPLGITEITRDGNGVTIHYGPNKTETIPFKINDTLKDQDIFIKSLSKITGIGDVNKALKNGGYNANKPFNPKSSGGAKTDTAPTGKSEYIKYTDNLVTPDLIGKKQGEAVQELAPALSKFGIKVEGSGFMFGNQLRLTKTFKNDKGEDVESSINIEVNETDPNTRAQEAGKLKAFILQNAPSDATLETLKQQGVFGGSTPNQGNLGNSASTLNAKLK